MPPRPTLENFRAVTWCMAGFALALWLAVTSVVPAAARERTLANVEAEVEAAHAGLSQLPPERLAEMLSEPHDVVVFDVREEAEFAVSHIPGAIRVSPSVWTSRFLSERAEAMKGKTVVFYCSVGVRSSRLAARVQAGLAKSGATAVYNLRGGIFRWHNEGRPLQSGVASTEHVHPYDASWGRLVQRQNLVRTTPQPP